MPGINVGNITYLLPVRSYDISTLELYIVHYNFKAECAAHHSSNKISSSLYHTPIAETMHK